MKTLSSKWFAAAAALALMLPYIARAAEFRAEDPAGEEMPAAHEDIGASASANVNALRLGAGITASFGFGPINADAAAPQKAPAPQAVKASMGFGQTEAPAAAPKAAAAEKAPEEAYGIPENYTPQDAFADIPECADAAQTSPSFYAAASSARDCVSAAAAKYGLNRMKGESVQVREEYGPVHTGGVLQPHIMMPYLLITVYGPMIEGNRFYGDLGKAIEMRGAKIFGYHAEIRFLRSRVSEAAPSKIRKALQRRGQAALKSAKAIAGQLAGGSQSVEIPDTNNPVITAMNKIRTVPGVTAVEFINGGEAIGVLFKTHWQLDAAFEFGKVPKAIDGLPVKAYVGAVLPAAASAPKAAAQTTLAAFQKTYTPNDNGEFNLDIKKNGIPESRLGRLPSAVRQTYATLKKRSEDEAVTGEMYNAYALKFGGQTVYAVEGEWGDEPQYELVLFRADGSAIASWFAVGGEGSWQAGNIEAAKKSKTSASLWTQDGLHLFLAAYKADLLQIDGVQDVEVVASGPIIADGHGGARPAHYVLHIIPDAAAMTTQGEARIRHAVLSRFPELKDAALLVGLAVPH